MNINYLLRVSACNTIIKLLLVLAVVNGFAAQSYWTYVACRNGSHCNLLSDTGECVQPYSHPDKLVLDLRTPEGLKDELTNVTGYTLKCLTRP